MNITECAKCGEEYPLNWGVCPFCDTGERPDIRRFDDED